MGIRWYQARTLQEWAEACVARDEVGDVERAQALLKQALALFEEMDVPFYVTQVQERLEALA